MYRGMLFRPDGGGTGGSGVSEQATIVQPVVQPTAAAPTPPAPDGRSAVEIASEAARARIAEGKPAVADATDAAAAPIAPVSDAAKAAADKATADAAAEKEKQARASDGTFAPPVPGEGDAAADAASEKVVSIKLPDAEADTPIEFDDPKVAEFIRDRIATAADAETISAQAREQIEEVMMVRESVNVDPVGFVLGEIATQPAAIEHLVLTLLTDVTHKDLLAKVAKIAADPNELRLVASEQKAARGEYRDQAVARIAEERAVSTNLAEVQAALGEIARGLPEAGRRVAYADFMRDVQKYAERHNMLTVDPQDLPLLLAPRLAALGIDAAVAAQQMAAAVAAKRSGKRAPARKGTTPAAPAAGAAPAAAATVAAKSGQSFVESAERRRAISVPGSGAGSPGTGPVDMTPPKNADGSSMSIEQVTQWHRARIQKGQRAY